jgi:hypothetical protein
MILTSSPPVPRDKARTLHFVLSGALVDFDIAHPCRFQRLPLDVVALFYGAVDVVPAALIFENGSEISPLAVS